MGGARHRLTLTGQVLSDVRVQPSSEPRDGGEGEEVDQLVGELSLQLHHHSLEEEVAQVNA